MTVGRYCDREYSLVRVAEFAGVSLWRFFDLLDERGVEANYTKSDLANDFAAAHEE
jgi:predicted HTH domain antitoxin